MRHEKCTRASVMDIILKAATAYPKLEIVDIRTDEHMSMRNIFMDSVQEKCFKYMPAIKFTMEDISFDSIGRMFENLQGDTEEYVRDNIVNYLELRFKNYLKTDDPVLFICEYGYIVSDTVDNLGLKNAMILQVNNATCDYRDCDIAIDKGLKLYD